MWIIWNGCAGRLFDTIMHTLFKNLFNSMIIEIILPGYIHRNISQTINKGTSRYRKINFLTTSA